MKEEISRRMNIITRTELDEKNLVKATNTEVIAVAAYSMNVCKFTQSELMDLDQVIKSDLRKNNMLGWQASNERLHMKRKDGGRGLKSLREIYEVTRLRIRCCMFVSDNRWIKKAWKQETRKECNSIKDEIILTMQTKGKTAQFEGEDMTLEVKILDREFKPICKQVKKCFKKDSEEKQIGQYRKKEIQSEIYNKQDEKCNIWREQNLTPRRASAVMSMIEKNEKNEKEVRGLTENSQCRLCKEQREAVQHLLTGFKMLATNKYLARQNRALMVMAAGWVKEENLLDQYVKWDQEKWKRGHVLGNSQVKLVGDFEFNSRKTTISRRPDLMLEEKQTKIIWICNMACPQENDIEKKRLEERTSYKQLAFEIRERRPGFKVSVVSQVTSAFGRMLKKY